MASIIRVDATQEWAGKARSPRTEGGLNEHLERHQTETRPQLNAGRTGLAIAVAAAITLRQPLATLLAILGIGLGADLQLPQPLGGESRSSRAAGRHHRSSRRARGGPSSVGHRVCRSVQVDVSHPTLPRNPMATDTCTHSWDVTRLCPSSFRQCIFVSARQRR